MLDRPGVFTERTPRVVRARGLLRRARRDDERLFLAEGPQAVREAVPAATELFGTDEALARYPEIADAARDAGVRVSVVTEKALAGLADTQRPQGLVAVCRYSDVPLAAALARRPRLVVVLANIADPGNAGTVLRTADAAGAGAVVFTDNSVDVYNGKCVRSSAGSLFHLDVVRGGDPAAVVEELRAAGLWVAATDLRGADDLDALADDGVLDRPTAWLFGSEAHGLSAELSAAADARVKVPIHGRAESLNLAAAAAVCLYTSARAQRPSRGADERGRRR
ncbi:TrmH family RNA methyltransferase [Actinocatenispora rupis]|uniref:RNA methyltransferase n=1 Tax=Actinocatenispora rupis TaxID=519421 RepID=A0A8J3J3W1_9ACTN|nr:RNA methyltransferase [Actinocatenispora rupis]GID11146.1 RNA methyltransferase [Actinocatenispora rupis]